MSPPGAPATKRWGLRTLAWLALAAVSVVASNLLYSAGNDDYVLVTFLGLVTGLAGAAFCSVRGLRSWSWPPKG